VHQWSKSFLTTISVTNRAGASLLRIIRVPTCGVILLTEINLPLVVMKVRTRITIHLRVYTVSRSVEQQLHHGKEIVRLVDTGVLEDDYSSE
jgi:hypothetical protein